MNPWLTPQHISLSTDDNFTPTKDLPPPPRGLTRLTWANGGEVRGPLPCALTAIHNRYTRIRLPSVCSSQPLTTRRQPRRDEPQLKPIDRLSL